MVEMYRLWKDGLRYTRWASVVDQLRFDSIRRRRWSMLETIYTLERIAEEYGHEPMLREATFILKKEENRPQPDFRVWISIGPLYVYAHDDLTDHREWVMADVRNQFIWEAVYLDILPPHVAIQVPRDSDVGLQLAQVPEEGENPEDENENVESEEEEDPEEDPNWIEDDMVVVPESPRREEENVPVVPNPIVWNLNPVLEIPDSGRTDVEQDNVVWRDVHEVNDYQRMIQEAASDPMEMDGGEDALRNEARMNVDRIWEEAGREVNNDPNVGNENSIAVEEEEEQEERQEIVARPTRRRRLTVRAYLSQFIRSDDGSSSSRSRLPSPIPEDPNEDQEEEEEQA